MGLGGSRVGYRPRTSAFSFWGDKGRWGLGSEETKQRGRVKMPSCSCTSEEPVYRTANKCVVKRHGGPGSCALMSENHWRV